MQRDIDMIDDLLAQGKENQWIEFKHNNEAHEMIGELCSALSNSATIYGENKGYCIWGVDDNTKSIIGTTFDPHTKRVNNQPFLIWLSRSLQPAPEFNFKEISHPNGRVILLNHRFCYSKSHNVQEQNLLPYRRMCNKYCRS